MTRGTSRCPLPTPPSPSSAALRKNKAGAASGAHHASENEDALFRTTSSRVECSLHAAVSTYEFHRPLSLPSIVALVWGPSSDAVFAGFSLLLLRKKRERLYRALRKTTEDSVSTSLGHVKGARNPLREELREGIVIDEQIE